MQKAFTEIQSIAARRLAAHKQAQTLDSEDAKALVSLPCHSVRERRKRDTARPIASSKASKEVQEVVPNHQPQRVTRMATKQKDEAVEGAVRAYEKAANRTKEATKDLQNALKAAVKDERISATEAKKIESSTLRAK